jgi:NAD(P)-dependent dehydrogenase (short-subunit alcohol dehydrogenase family)
MSLYALIKPRGPSGFGYGSTAEDVTAGLALQGKTVLVTGCNSGLGNETMRVLALHGAYVIGTARTDEKAELASALIGNQTLGVSCDLADPVSIRACVARVKTLKVKLDVIVCNAGIMALPHLTLACGYELQFFTNHMGHFILVTELLDTLAEDGRVVVLSSAAHWVAPRGGIEFDNLSGAKSYKPVRAYGQSKLANLLFAKELARRFVGTARTANAVHPGIILTTKLIRNLNLPRPIKMAGVGLLTPLVYKSISQGAATSCYVAVNPANRGVSGQYFADCNVAKPSSDANDRSLSMRLWEVSEGIASSV